MGEFLKLPIIDLSSPHRASTAKSIRQACIEHGFFYLVNHGIEEELMERVFTESGKFFSLPLEEKMRWVRKEFRGYTPLYAENLDPSSSSKGDSKESFYIGPVEGVMAEGNLNQWPSEGKSRNFAFVETHNGILLYKAPNFFENVGALKEPAPFLRLLHYPGDLGSSDEETYGASAHSDYGMITLLATDGVPGLQVCKDKSKQPGVWEDVPGIRGGFVVNIGDMMERWSNGVFRSTLHRVMPHDKHRFSAAFFLDPNPDCVVECLESCCNESCPPRFAPIRSGDYLKERFRRTYGS